MKSFAQSVIARLRDESGVNAVEMALSCTVLFALLIGICQMSIGLYSYQFCSDAARQATRYAMVRGSTSCTNTPSLSKCNASTTDISTYVKGLGYTGITSSSVTVTTSWCAASSSTPTTWSTCSSGTTNAPGNLGSTSQMVVSQ